MFVDIFELLFSIVGECCSGLLIVMFSVSVGAVEIFVTPDSFKIVLSSCTETTSSLYDSSAIEALNVTFGILNVSFCSLQLPEKKAIYHKFKLFPFYSR